MELIFIYTSIIFSIPLTHLINWACFKIGNVGKNTNFLMGRILLMDNKQNQFLFAYSIRFWFAYKKHKMVEFSHGRWILLTYSCIYASTNPYTCQNQSEIPSLLGIHSTKTLSLLLFSTFSFRIAYDSTLSQLSPKTP